MGEVKPDLEPLGRINDYLRPIFKQLLEVAHYQLRPEIENAYKLAAKPFGDSDEAIFHWMEETFKANKFGYLEATRRLLLLEHEFNGLD